MPQIEKGGVHKNGIPAQTSVLINVYKILTLNQKET